MSHGLTVRKSGKVEMAYTGEAPWHGLGEQMQDGASIEQWLVAAGMDWKVKRSKVRYVTDDSGAMAVDDDNHVLFRSDSGAKLGIVSDTFKVVQPRAVLEFFRDLCASNGFKMETAGTLRGGAVYWALASINESEFVGTGDQLRGRLLLSTACDGTRKTTGKNVAERVVCRNTLAIADAESGKREVSVSHRSQFNPEDVKRNLGISRSAFEQFVVTARTLAAKKLTPAEIKHLQLSLFGEVDPVEMLEEQKIQVLDSKHARAVEALFAGAGRGATLASSRGTAWGYLNAVTEYVDHHFPSRSDENRLTSAWFGFGDRLKDRALEAVQVIAA